MRASRRVLGLAALLSGLAAAATAQDFAMATPISDTNRRAVLSGIVRDTLGHPIPYVYVWVDEGWGVVTNDSGLFRVAGLPSGRSHFTVRRIGYQPVYFPMHMLPDTTIYVSIQMKPLVQRMRTVTVEEKRASMALNRVGFYDRAEQGWGTFLFPTDIVDRQPQTVTDLLHGINGIEIEARWGGAVHVMSTSGCELNVFLDGQRWRYGREGIGAINPSDIKAMEIYPRPGTTPVNFRTGDRGTCGSLVLWTKID